MLKYSLFNFDRIDLSHEDGWDETLFDTQGFH